MKAIFALALAFVVPGHADADCALIGLVPKVLSAPDVVLADDGGIVVGAIAEDRAPLDRGDVAVQKAWRYVLPRGAFEPGIEALAPGLAVYKTGAVVLDLRNGKGETLARATRGGKRDKLAAPAIKSIRYDAPISRRQVVKVEVTLDGQVPAGAIALVLADAKGQPRSWTKAEGTVLTPYYQRDCLTLPNGTVPSKKGERVTLFWVDASGRKSAFTKPMTIK